jgi:peptidoglycan/LPS O-acetylase OafA/YrhL
MGTGASRSYQSLQPCRGVAALRVALYHLGIAIASPRYFGISGFAVPFLSATPASTFSSS